MTFKVECLSKWCTVPAGCKRTFLSETCSHTNFTLGMIRDVPCKPQRSVESTGQPAFYAEEWQTKISKLFWRTLVTFSPTS
jgi:hypothetical protein